MYTVALSPYPSTYTHTHTHAHTHAHTHTPVDTNYLSFMQELKGNEKLKHKERKHSFMIDEMKKQIKDQ